MEQGIHLRLAPVFFRTDSVMISATEAAASLTDPKRVSDTPPDRVPGGSLATKWTRHKDTSRLINSANRRKYNIIVVGSGLAGAAAAATLSEQGYQVKCF